jgi:hypothetical protein
MIAYVGLDLGVDTSVVTNSFAPKLHLRDGQNLKVDTEQGQHTQSIRELSVVLDLCRHEEEGQNI